MLSVFMTSLLFAFLAPVQETDTGAASAGDIPTQPASFADALADWNAFQQEGTRLRAEFDKAPDDKKNALRTEFIKFASGANAKLDALKAAAIRDYEAAPNSNEQVTDTLAGIMLNAASSDDDITALDIGEMLAANNCPQAVFDRVAASPRLTNSLFAKSLMDEILVRRKEIEQDDLPRVKFTTSKGDIVIELFENEAPNTVANFIELVESGFYKNSEFHRVLEGFVAQGGRREDLKPGEGPGFTIECECYRIGYRNHFTGSLSMAHKGPKNTGGSQFFITFSRTTGLDGKHTVFGRVVEGMDIVHSLQKIDPNREEDKELKADVIQTAEVVRKRDHKYEPARIPVDTSTSDEESAEGETASDN